ncbi:DUF4259 domain-containing protein [Streptomyces sp. NBC_00597]|uniref:DUF4259 domain-containing protein n=1 Tax=Streptomyces sp. NBC_00597 TaxID=2975786 RepID=UPI002F91507E
MPAALRDRSGSCTLPCAVPRGGRSADAGPFGNDTAADFADVFDDTESEAREALIRGVLIPTIDATGHLPEADEAVAAALIAARCPGGEPVDTPYGPETPMPLFPSDFRALADEAPRPHRRRRERAGLELGRPGGPEEVAGRRPGLPRPSAVADSAG